MSRESQLPINLARNKGNALFRCHFAASDNHSASLNFQQPPLSFCTCDERPCSVIVFFFWGGDGWTRPLKCSSFELSKVLELQHPISIKCQFSWIFQGFQKLTNTPSQRFYCRLSVREAEGPVRAWWRGSLTSCGPWILLGQLPVVAEY